MIVKAATASHPLAGILTMVFFGAGTVPALFFAGLSVSLVSLRIRFLGERIAAVSVIFMGLILVFKGTKYLV
jgi:sulfite exporter TauE/SafE